VTTEITEVKNGRGWVLFDAQCLLCTRLARRCEPLLRKHGFALVPLETPWVRERLAKCGGELLSEMRLLTPHGNIYGGADALIALAQQIWWARPLYWFARLPLVRAALRKVYAGSLDAEAASAADVRLELLRGGIKQSCSSKCHDRYEQTSNRNR
jgi:predicted DCC family thiol-disulfide oxidoreductase YuxK